MHRIKAMYAKWKKNRQIKDFCLSQSGVALGSKKFNRFFFFFLLILLAFWQAHTYQEMLANLFVAMLGGSALLYFFNKREYERLLRDCRNKLANIELNRRIERMPQQEMLSILKEKIAALSKVQSLWIDGEMLVGTYEGEKLAVFYRCLGSEEALSGREIMHILHDCRARRIKRVRIFTNGEYSGKVSQLGERYDLELKIYDGPSLLRFLKGSSVYPSEDELAILLRRESEKRQRSIQAFKKEVLERGKFRRYVSYGLVLIAMARFGLGFFYLNIIFAVLLLSLAVFSLVLSRQKAEEDTVF